MIKTSAPPTNWFGRRDPDDRGYFGAFGGRFVPETLVAPIQALEEEYLRARQDAAFASELKIRYPLGFPDKSLSDFFLSDNQTIPQTFVFGRDGNLVKRFVGYDSSIGTELERTIQAALEK